MAVNRASIVDDNFIQLVNSFEEAEKADVNEEFDGLKGWEIVDIFHTMMTSRHLDIRARELKKTDRSYYTIGSSGHEGNACVAKVMRHTDPAFLHYRSGPFYLQRAKQIDGVSGPYDVLLGIVASHKEPIAGGRHKVFGSLPLNIPPQTSTIASHLPKAVGSAFTIARKKRLALESDIPEDSIVVCTFGDASSNHSTACGAFNTAALADYQNLPCPILFVCEDNGIGISVRTPKNWIESRFAPNPGIKYFSANGLSMLDCHRVAKEAVEYVRRTRRPTFLHIKLVRLLGHAGSDVEQLYRSQQEIELWESQDPLLEAAHLVHSLGLMSKEKIIWQYEQIREQIEALGKQAVQHRQLRDAKEVMIPLSPLEYDKIAQEAKREVSKEERRLFHYRLPEEERPRHLAMLLNRGLGDILCKYKNTLIFGEDVGKKGGVYHVTAELQKKAGLARVFNTPLDETAILGLAIGASQLGMIAIPEIQYLAYLHNAIDQIRGEACSLQFFSKGQFQNPMVVRIASYAYQKGFGGHFHNDNSVAALRDIPGLILASPSNGTDAVLMLRTCIAAAKMNGTVSVFLEPIALYMTKDLYQEKDGLWLCDYPSHDQHIAIGESKTWTQGKDCTIFSYANGLWMSLRVAKKLEEEQGISCRVVDIRWLNPLPERSIIEEAKATGRVLVVDECRKTGGMAEPILGILAEECSGIKMTRIAGQDTYIPLGNAANRVLIQEEDIEEAILRLMEKK